MIEILHIYSSMFSRSSAADLLYLGKGHILVSIPHDCVNPFPTYRRFLTPLQQMTFENIMSK